MHELSIARALIDAAARRAEGRRVVALSVSVGALRQVVPATLSFNFAIASTGTPCAGAHLELLAVPVRLRCPCWAEWELQPGELAFRCPRCGSPDAVVLSGEELSLDSIEVQED